MSTILGSSDVCLLYLGPHSDGLNLVTHLLLLYGMSTILGSTQRWSESGHTSPIYCMVHVCLLYLGPHSDGLNLVTHLLLLYGMSTILGSTQRWSESGHTSPIYCMVCLLYLGPHSDGLNLVTHLLFTVWYVYYTWVHTAMV